MNYIYETELYHHGIKGQRWGIRRWQNEDGSYNSKGKERYFGKNSSSNTGSTNKNYKISSNNHVDENADPKVSKLQLSIEEKQRLNKILLATATGSLACVAGVAYIKYKHEHEDYTLKAGQTIKRMQTDSSGTVHDQFYASTNEVDAIKYLGKFGLEQKAGGILEDGVYQLSMSPKKDLKIAGTDSAKKIYKEMASKGLFSDNNLSYDRFNQMIVTRQKDQTKFMEELIRRGYAGVIDVNDSRKSGYGSDRPVILFKQQENINIDKNRKVSLQELVIDDIAANAVINGQMLAPILLSGVAGATALSAVENNIEIDDLNKEIEKLNKGGK